MALCDSVLVE